MCSAFLIEKLSFYHVRKKRFVLCIITFLLIQSSISEGRGAKRFKQKKLGSSEDSSDFITNEGLDLIALVENELQLDLHDHEHYGNLHSSLSRKARSPLDEDIDEDDDDDDDEEGDEEDANDNSKANISKEEAKAKPASKPTSLPFTSETTSNSAASPQISKPSSTIHPLTSSTNSINVKPSTDKLITAAGTTFPTPIIVNEKSGNTINGTGGGPPVGFKLPHQAGKPPFKIPPPTHGRPGPPIFPGGKLPPLPPHLLKQLSAPKAPIKKGELNLPEDYNNLVIPKLNLGKLIGIDSYSAVPVLVFLNIRSVRDIDETMETLTLDLDLVIEWVDGFLFDPISASIARQPDITLNPIFLKKIWRPDIYIDEIVKVKRTSLMNKPLKLKFNPSNGFISYTTRLIVHLSCDMIYKYYPADTHRCEFTFRSYSYFGKDLDLSWLGTGVYLQDPYDANFDLQVESIDRVKIPQTFRKLTNDTYDGLRFTILARRKLSFHMVQTYLPSIFFIVITWLCFLVPSRMVEARIGISMTTLLTLTSMFASVRESTPIVSYVKAIDIWMVFCIFFVFLTLLEFATLVWLRSRREEAEVLKLEYQRKLQQTGDKEKDLGSPYKRSPSIASVELEKYERFAEFTEKYAFAIFSIVFIGFNVIYWSWLLVASDYYDWTVNSTLNAEVD